MVNKEQNETNRRERKGKQKQRSEKKLKKRRKYDEIELNLIKLDKNFFDQDELPFLFFFIISLIAVTSSTSPSYPYSSTILSS